jgi:hypothetical protein
MINAFQFKRMMKKSSLGIDTDIDIDIDDLFPKLQGSDEYR